MKNVVLKSSLGALALVCSSVTMASTVTMVPSSASVANSGTFNVVLHGDQFQKTNGASLGLTFNSALVTLNSIQLCTVALCGTLSPFDATTQLISGAFTVSYGASGNVCNADYAGPGGAAFAVTPCSFDAVRFNFTAAASGTGAANIQLVDNGGLLCWGDVETFDCLGNPPSTISPPTYTQANVFVGVPVPAAAWLFGSGLGLLGLVRRRITA